MFEDVESLRKIRGKVLRLADKGWTVIENNEDTDQMPAHCKKIIGGLGRQLSFILEFFTARYVAASAKAAMATRDRWMASIIAT